MKIVEEPRLTGYTRSYTLNWWDVMSLLTISGELNVTLMDLGSFHGFDRGTTNFLIDFFAKPRPTHRFTHRLTRLYTSWHRRSESRLTRFCDKTTVV